MGVETCEDSQWGACATKMSCLGLQFPCVNGNGIATDYECLDGTSKTGTMTCFKPLGIDCETSFYSGWGPGECQDLCIGPGDTCDVLGQDRTCEVHCDFGTGETKQGSQTCDTFCDDNKVWGPCMTDQACNE